MGTITQNLEKLVAAKSAIAAAIVAKGGTVGENDGFESFSEDIALIKNGHYVLKCLEFSGTAPFTLKTSAGKYWDGILEYSTDKVTWQTWDGSSTNAISSGTGNKLYIRGKNNTKISGKSVGDYSSFIFTTTGEIACVGDIRSLLDWESVSVGYDPVMGDCCFYAMFRQCTSLTIPPSLPSKEVSNYGYRSMFTGCTNLSALPELPANTLGDMEGETYKLMFNGCSKIKLSETQTENYRNEFRIPKSGSAPYSAENDLVNMFAGTGGTFVGTPTIETTYYTSNDIVKSSKDQEMASGTVTEYLQRLVDAKNNIAATIVSKGGTVNQGDGFEEFASDISTIPKPVVPGIVQFTQWDDSWTLENFQSSTGAIYYAKNELPESIDRQASDGAWIVYNVNMSTSKFLIATYKKTGEFYSTATGDIDYIKTKLTQNKKYYYFADVS